MAGMFRNLRADEIDCRIGQIKDNGLTLLLYKDARCDMNILDETFGPMGWQRHHSRENANCIVSVYDEQKGEWIEKEDTGTESNTEAEKGLASDSFKRACVNWGIGRELYTAPFIWIGSDKCKIENKKCYDKFHVAEIGYNERGEINKLVIANSDVDVFAYPKQSLFQKPQKTPVEAPDGLFYCEECNNEVKAVKFKNGKEYTVKEILDGSMKNYGKQLCYDCVKKHVKQTT